MEILVEILVLLLAVTAFVIFCGLSFQLVFHTRWMSFPSAPLGNVVMAAAALVVFLAMTHRFMMTAT